MTVEKYLPVLFMSSLMVKKVCCERQQNMTIEISTHGPQKPRENPDIYVYISIYKYIYIYIVICIKLIHTVIVKTEHNT